MATADDFAATVASAYNTAQQRADNSLSRSDQAISSASSSVAGLWVNWGPGFRDPTDTIPGAIPRPSLPVADYSADVKTAYDYALSRFDSDLQPQIVSFIEEWFPDIAEAVKTDSDNWIINTIANGNFVPQFIEDGIWDRARDREVREGLRAEQSILDAIAARGFAMPPGTVLAAITANQQATQERISTMTRDHAIKGWEIANENTKYAIEQAVKLRTAFVGALADFIKTATAYPNQAADYAKTYLAAKTTFYDSAIRLYAANISEEEAVSRTKMHNREMEHKWNATWQEGADMQMKSRIAVAQVQATAALAAAEQYSKVATGALGTVNHLLSSAAAA